MQICHPGPWGEASETLIVAMCNISIRVLYLRLTPGDGSIPKTWTAHAAKSSQEDERVCRPTVLGSRNSRFACPGPSIRRGNFG